LQLPFCYVSPQNLYASLLNLTPPIRALFCYIQCSRFLKIIRIVKVGSKNNLKLENKKKEGGKMGGENSEFTFNSQVQESLN